ncbi:MAG: HEAT repeat domain-containing protein, partial [Flavobacteriales bacterium]
HGIDQRETEAVTPFLKSENDSLVLMALNGCISIGDSTLIPALTPLLNHSNLKLISTATLALGATEHPSAADSLLSRYKADKSLGSPELWYALGRTVNAEQYDDALKLAKTAPDSEASNWLLYWSSLRGITSSSAIEMALSSYVSVEKEQRLAAASFLSRSPNSSLGAEHKGLVQFFKAENDPEVRAALALAFRHDNVLGTMDVMKMLLNEKDERCQASLLRAAWKNQLLGPEDVMPLLTPQEHPLVRSSVSNWLKDQVWTEATYEYFSENFNPKDSVVSPHLLTGIIRYHEGSDFWQEKAKQLVSSSLSNYTKAAYVKCLEGQSDEVTYLINLMDESNSSPIRTAAAETLIATHKFGKWTNPISILDAMEIAFASGDPTLLSLFAIHLADPEMDFKTSFTNHDWLQNALQKLSLPEETESERDIKRALAYLNDENFIVPDPVYNYPPVFTNLYDT